MSFLFTMAGVEIRGISSWNCTMGYEGNCSRHDRINFNHLHFFCTHVIHSTQAYGILRPMKCGHCGWNCARNQAQWREMPWPRSYRDMWRSWEHSVARMHRRNRRAKKMLEQALYQRNQGAARSCRWRFEPARYRIVYRIGYRCLYSR